MVILQSCCCCDLLLGSILAAVYTIMTYLAAFSLSLWWLLDATMYHSMADGGRIPGYVLCAGHLLLVLASLFLLYGLYKRLERVVICWVVLMVLVFFPEMGLVLFVNLYYRTVATPAGLVDLGFYIGRAALNVVCIICVYSLYNTWKLYSADKFKKAYPNDLNHKNMEDQSFYNTRKQNGSQYAGSQFGGSQYQSNRQFAGSQYAGSQVGGSQYQSPRQIAGSQYAGSQVGGSQYQSPRQIAGSQYAGSQYAGSQYGGSQYQNPRQIAGGQFGGSQYQSNRQFPGSQYAGSQFGGSHYQSTRQFANSMLNVSSGSQVPNGRMPHAPTAEYQINQGFAASNELAPTRIAPSFRYRSRSLPRTSSRLSLHTQSVYNSTTPLPAQFNAALFASNPSLNVVAPPVPTPVGYPGYLYPPHMLHPRMLHHNDYALQSAYATQSLDRRRFFRSEDCDALSMRGAGGRSSSFILRARGSQHSLGKESDDVRRFKDVAL